MWIPDDYRAPDGATVERVLSTFGLADFVTATAEGPMATPLPFVYDPSVGDRGVLRGHLARENPHWQHRSIGPALLMINVADAYVSAAWYPTLGDYRVPTWNMITVHVYGDLTVHDDRDWCAANVAELVAKHEAIQGSGWSLAQADRSYVTGMLHDIVGLEIAITRVDAKFKLSQDKSATDHASVVEHLRRTGSTSAAAIADAMEG